MAAKAPKFDPGSFVSPTGHPRDRIIIHENADLPKDGIFISLNGYAFLAKANVEIDLPRPVRLMLDTRIKTESRMVDNGPGRGTEIHTRNIPRITYTLIKEDVGSVPDASVIDAAGEGEGKQVDFP